MPIEIKHTEARHKSTFIARVTFRDASDVAIAPTSATWSLYDSGGNIMNAREDEAITTPASTEDIVLSGEDLDWFDSPKRQLVISAIYDSDEGNDLPLVEVIKFDIEKPSWLPTNPEDV